jgi:hypothetical protein
MYTGNKKCDTCCKYSVCKFSDKFLKAEKECTAKVPPELDGVININVSCTEHQPSDIRIKGAEFNSNTIETGTASNYVYGTGVAATPLHLQKDK